MRAGRRATVWIVASGEAIRTTAATLPPHPSAAAALSGGISSACRGSD